MSWIQVKDANWKIPYVGGLCEGFVEGAWGQATKPSLQDPMTYGVYPSAMAAWEAQPVKHTDRPPAGVTVPVYFSLGSTKAGHVAISLSDGAVASSTQGGFHTQGYIHKNLDDLIAIYAKYNNGCKYLGWGEYVGKVHVVSQQINVKKDEDMPTEKEIIAFFKTYEAKAPTKHQIEFYKARSWTSLANDLLKSQQSRVLKAINK